MIITHRYDETHIINGCLLHRNFSEEDGARPVLFKDEHDTSIDYQITQILIYKTPEYVYYLDVPDTRLDENIITPEYILSHMNTIKLDNFTGETKYYTEPGIVHHIKEK